MTAARTVTSISFSPIHTNFLICSQVFSLFIHSVLKANFITKNLPLTLFSCLLSSLRWRDVRAGGISPPGGGCRVGGRGWCARPGVWPPCYTSAGSARLARPAVTAAAPRSSPPPRRPPPRAARNPPRWLEPRLDPGRSALPLGGHRHTLHYSPKHN